MSIIINNVVWSDVCEADYIANSPEGIDYQIFGHSQQEYLPIITNKIKQKEYNFIQRINYL